MSFLLILSQSACRELKRRVLSPKSDEDLEDKAPREVLESSSQVEMGKLEHQERGSPRRMSSACQRVWIKVSGDAGWVSVPLGSLQGMSLLSVLF